MRRASFAAALAVVAIAIGIVTAELVPKPVAAAPAGISLVRDWVRDEATAQPTSAYFTKTQADARYLKLTGGTMTGTISSSVASGSYALNPLTEGARVGFGPDTFASESGTEIVFTAVSGIEAADMAISGGSASCNIGSFGFGCTSAGDSVQIYQTAESDTAGRTSIIISGTEPDAVATNSAVRICSSTAPAANAVLMEVVHTSCSISAQGTQVLRVDTEGDVTLGNSATDGKGDIWSYGGDIGSLATNASFFIQSNSDDTAVTATQGAFVFSAIQNFADGDVLFGIDDNGSTNGSAFRITTYGAQDNASRNATPTAATGVAAVFNGQILHKVSAVTIGEAALTAGAGTEDETPWSTIPTKARLLRLSGHVTAAFAGPSITDVKLMCGPSGGSNTYLISQDVDVLNAALGDVAADIGASLTAATVADIPSMTATSAVVCRFTCTGANCSVMTAGSVTLFLEYLVYP